MLKAITTEKKKLQKKIFVLHISSCCAEILGETNFQPPEIRRSGSKAKDRKEKEEKRQKVCNNSGQLRIANATSGGTLKAAWANFQLIQLNNR